MPLQSHLNELEKRRQAVKRALHTVLNHPSSDDLERAELKRKNLSLKDEISRLKSSADLSS